MSAIRDTLITRFCKSCGHANKTILDIQYSVVLAYLLGEALPGIEAAETLLPEVVERAPRRYAICYRNRWMLEKADCVVTYIRHTYGGAARYAAQAERRGKEIVRL